MLNDQSNHKQENPIKTFLVLLLIVIFFVLASPFLLPGYLRGISLRIGFRKIVSHQGKFVLFIYSDSPVWETYIEQNILPHIQNHAILLNWSDRSRWDRKSWEVKAFHHWGGENHFNPMAIVYCNFANVKVIRFYEAFRDFKHGKTSTLQKVETQFLQLVEAKKRTLRERKG